MEEGILYKYLDVEGGAAMLYNGNLMFTNATQLNDPFECHPSLIDYSNAPSEVVGPWNQKTIENLEVNHAEQLRNGTWVCSLSYVCRSILMWTFYAKNHQGVCIGIDMKKAEKYLDRVTGLFVGCPQIDVNYKELVERPDGFRDKLDFFTYQLGTKAKEWEYEQEARLICVNPSPMFMKLLQEEKKTRRCEVICEKICNAINIIKSIFGKNMDVPAPIDWRTIHAFADLGGECFHSLRLGVNIDKNKREKMIRVARQLNPEIKIYQMTIAPEAFRLKEEIIES